MGKSTTRKLWCIRILSGGAYLFKGGKKVESFLNIIGAEYFTSWNIKFGLLIVPHSKETLKVIELLKAYVMDIYYKRTDISSVLCKLSSKDQTFLLEKVAEM